MYAVLTNGRLRFRRHPRCYGLYVWSGPRVFTPEDMVTSAATVDELLADRQGFKSYLWAVIAKAQRIPAFDAAIVD